MTHAHTLATERKTRNEKMLMGFPCFDDKPWNGRKNKELFQEKEGKEQKEYA